MFRSSIFLPLLFSAGSLGAMDFVHEVAPVLRKHCLKCHSNSQQKGGLSMNSRADLLRGGESGPAALASKSHASLMIERITSSDGDERMPPKGPALQQAEVNLLRQWIDQGLPWPEDFAFEKPRYDVPLLPRKPSLPEPSQPGRNHPIDRIIDQHLAKLGRKPPEGVSNEVFLRRAALDLIGLLPSQKQRQRFTGSKPESREKLIEDLLADELAYAEHWLTFWNDLLRNDYGGTGFITGGRRQISGWLHAALRENKPFDAMVRELIAPADKQSSGFIEGIAWRGDVSAGQTVEIQFAQSVGQAFLGINLKCASCHDSFVDHWKLDQAYGLAAIYSQRPLEIARCDKGTGRMAQASWLFPQLGQIDPKLDQPKRLQQLAALMVHPQNGRLRRTLVNRIWHRLMGRGIVHPLDSMENKPWSEDLLDHLATEFANHQHDLRHLIAHIAQSRAYQSQSEILHSAPDESKYLYNGPRSRRLSAEQFVDALWTLTGAGPTQMDAPVLRFSKQQTKREVAAPVAEWIWASLPAGQTPPAGQTVVLRRSIELPAVPTTATALVCADNRFEFYVNGRSVGVGTDWQRPQLLALQTHLKAGNNALVIVAKNEGNGPNPAAAWLAMRLSLPGGKSLEFGSDSQWQSLLHEVNAREGRLGALPAKGWQTASPVKALSVWNQSIKAQLPLWHAAASGEAPRPVRASLIKADFLMRSLGRPNRDQIVSARPDDLTTLEAMDLANGAALSRTLQQGAEALLKEGKWQDAQSFARWLYPAALTRQPSAVELQAIVESQGQPWNAGALADLLWAVMMLPEFQRIF